METLNVEHVIFCSSGAVPFSWNAFNQFFGHHLFGSEVQIFDGKIFDTVEVR
jgi:hypothetical protein